MPKYKYKHRQQKVLTENSLTPSYTWHLLNSGFLQLPQATVGLTKLFHEDLRLIP